jgi:ferric enterobactin receptor
MVTGLQYFLSFVFVMSFSMVARSQTYRLSGSIYDRETKIPLANVHIAFKNSQVGVSTDSLGKFELFVFPGNYVLTISHLGYKTRSLYTLVDRNREINIPLTENLKVLEEVYVGSERTDENVTGTQIGTNKLNIESMAKLPSFMGEVDVVKSVLLLPGVTSVGEGNTGLNVRGGNSDQNLILMDGAPFFNSGHLLGFFSVFNPDVVDGITLYKGGIPSKYSGRTSSVLDVKLRNPNAEKWAASGGIGFVVNRLLVEGPIVSNKLNMLIAGRVSYPDYLFRMSSREEIKNTSANFYDLTTKWEYRMSDKSRIEFTGYVSNDNFKLSGDSLASVEINATSSKFNWQTINGSVTWYKQLSNNLIVRTSAVQAIYKSTISSPDSSNAFALTSQILYQSLHAGFDWTASAHHELNFGITANYYRVLPGTLTPNHPASNINYLRIPKETGLETGIYASDQWKISDQLSFQLGIRYSHWYAFGKIDKYEYMRGMPRTIESIVDTITYERRDVIRSFSGIEPRASITLKTGSTSSVKMNYNRMYQYIQQVSNTTASMPSDRWQLSTMYIDPQSVQQLSVGYFRNFNNDMFETSVELFYKDINNITDYKDGANLLLNPVPETAMLQGKGRAYGAEVFVKKKKGLVTGWLSYTYSQTHLKVNGDYPEEQINNGKWYAANYNKPNNLSIAINYRHDNRITYSANFAYSSGRPYTSPSDKYLVNGVYIPNYTGRNQNKLPDYHRLDVAITLDPNPKKKHRWKGSWTFSIYNVYARKNAYSVFFRTKNDNYALYLKKVNAYQLSILGTIFPSITYNFKL